jgi:hypothetical protein
MTYSIRPPVNPRFTSPPDELDGVLRRYFLAQLPQPWPAPPRLASDEQTPPASPRLAVGRYFRVATRCAVAAAVAFLVIGYLALQGWFPDPKPSGSKPDLEIGPFARPLLRSGHSVDRTPRGQRVGVDVQQSPNDPKSFIIRVEPLPAKK